MIGLRTTRAWQSALVVSFAALFAARAARGQDTGPPDAGAPDAQVEPNAPPIDPPVEPEVPLPEAPPPPDARALLEQAVLEYNAGRYPEAHALFRRAHELQPSARTLRGIGMAAFEMRQYVAALRALGAALTEPARPLTEEQRAHVESLVERARSYVGRLALDVSPASATIRIDGVPLESEDGSVWVDAGEHALAVSAEGYETRVVRVSVEGGGSRDVVVQLDRGTGETVDDRSRDADLLRPPTPEDEGPSFLGPAIVTALGVAAVLAAIPTGVVALSAESELANDCLSMVCPADSAPTLDRAEGLAIATDVLWISGAVVAAAGIVWWILTATGGKSDSPPTRTARAEVRF